MHPEFDDLELLDILAFPESSGNPTVCKQANTLGNLLALVGMKHHGSFPMIGLGSCLNTFDYVRVLVK